MPSYLIEFSYAPATVAALLRKPIDRTEAISTLASKLGGKLIGNWFAFGDYDAIIIIEGSNPVSAAACALAVMSSGAFTRFKTTLLLSPEEALSAMKQAAGLGYTPPGA